MGQSREAKKAAVKKLKDARKALNDNQQKELREARAQGHKLIPDESDTYLSLNHAVAQAEKDVPWYLR
jgi:hypothetical protein